MVTKQHILEGNARAAIIFAIPDLLKEFDTDPAKVLRKAGISPRLFDDPDNLISFQDRMHLLNVCKDVTRCEHFGLLVGKRGSLSSLGLIGYLVGNTPDLRSALTSLVHYFHLHAQGSLVLFDTGHELSFLGYSIYGGSARVADQVVDAAVCIVFNILRELCGPGWKPVEVCLARSKPAQTAVFRKTFKAPVRFDASKNGVYFSSDWLDRPVQGADSELYRLLEKQVMQLEEQLGDDFPEQVRRYLRIALLTKHASSGHVAEIFSIHTRTLHRMLDRCGTSYQQLLDECRFDIARHMLESPGAGNAQIAEMLGYSDARAFSRAFKRWSGLTPATWRKSIAS